MQGRVIETDANAEVLWSVVCSKPVTTCRTYGVIYCTVCLYNKNSLNFPFCSDLIGQAPIAFMTKLALMTRKCRYSQAYASPASRHNEIGSPFNTKR
jgi:hypothetical protein